MTLITDDNDNLVTIESSNSTFKIPKVTLDYYKGLKTESIEWFLGIVKSLHCNDHRKRRRNAVIEVAFQELVKTGSVGNCTMVFLSKLENPAVSTALSFDRQKYWFYKLMNYDYTLSIHAYVKSTGRYHYLVVTETHRCGTVTEAVYPLN